MYRWVDHTAELELHVEAPSEAKVFGEALAALGELLAEHSEAEPAPAQGAAGRGAGEGAPVQHEVTASAPDRATLLAEWLNELVFLAETEGFVPERVERLRLSEDELEATVSGRRASPPPLVKAVTYHRLEMRRNDGAWRATVVFDV